MTFSIPAFVVFALVGAVVLRLTPRPAFFVVANIFSVLFVWLFFGAHALAILALILAVGFGLIRLCERFGRVTIVPSLIFVVAAFLVVKRYPFVPQVDVLARIGAVVGVSYIVFRLVHLIIDAAERSIEPVEFQKFVSFNLFFMTLLSGPIMRFQDLGTWWSEKTVEMKDLLRVTWGFFKIVVISTPILQLNEFFIARAASLLGGSDSASGGAPGGTSLLEFNADSVAAAALWFVYLYFNFSGYMDVVIGAGRIAGIQIPENFNQPFRANSFLQFWNRWHMTLSFWFRTYIFSPLFKTLYKAAPQVGARSAQASLFATFLLVGAWHGTTWSFVICGVILGCGAVVNDAYQHAMNSRLGKKRMREINARFAYQCLCFGLTFAFLSVAFIPFWMPEREYFTFVRFFAGGAGLLTFVGLWVISTVLMALIRAGEDLLVAASQRSPEFLRIRISEQNLQAVALACAANAIVLVELLNVGQVRTFVYQTY
jgi:alginate O-acetyltransferase complex protein AlgI